MSDTITKDECETAANAVDALLKMLPKSKRFDALGAANVLFLLIEKAKRGTAEVDE